jgi:hypothetical protein
MGRHFAEGSLAEMGSAKAVGRVGVLAVALGIGTGLATMMGTPVARADSALDNLRPNISVSAGGTTVIHSGSATATTSGKQSLAIAVGKNSSATATGAHSGAVVIGNGSTASATATPPS